MIRRFAIALVAAAAVASALPAQAAPKTQQLYFGNAGDKGADGCTVVYTLAKAATPGMECSGTYSAAQGNGIIANETYSSDKKLTFKVDASRPITGTVYVAHFPPGTLTAGGQTLPPNLPGYANVTFTVKADSVTVGTFTASGPVLPLTGLKKDFSLPMPASLKNKTVKKITVALDWSEAVGLSGLSYTDPSASTMHVPVK